MNAGYVHGGYGSCSRTRRKSARGTYVTAKTPTIRSTITASTIAVASTISVDTPRPESESRIGRSWSPTSPNRRTLSRNVKMSQNARPSRRVCTVVSSGVYQPM